MTLVPERGRIDTWGNRTNHSVRLPPRPPHAEVFDMIFAPATANAIGAMLEHVPDTLIGKRDHAILLIGFAAALRRSELAALRGPDLEMHEEKSLASKLSNRDKTVGAPLCVV
jgi:integrase